MVDDLVLHVLAIGLHDRPGAVHSVAEVFSGRGLQMEAFHGTADSLGANGHAQALILFRASDERAHFVARVLRRLSSVSSAELLGLDDPRLVQSVLIQRIDGNTPEGVCLVDLNDGVALAAGAPAAMQSWLASPCAPRRLGAVRIDLMQGA